MAGAALDDGQALLPLVSSGAGSLFCSSAARGGSPNGANGNPTQPVKPPEPVPCAPPQTDRQRCHQASLPFIQPRSLLVFLEEKKKIYNMLIPELSHR